MPASAHDLVERSRELTGPIADEEPEPGDMLADPRGRRDTFSDNRYRRRGQTVGVRNAAHAG